MFPPLVQREERSQLNWLLFLIRDSGTRSLSAKAERTPELPKSRTPELSFIQRLSHLSANFTSDLR